MNQHPSASHAPDSGAAPKHACCAPAPAPDAPTAGKDPVCGMTVDPATTKFHASRDGREFHFCSERCHGKFVAKPGQYIGVAAKPAEAPSADAAAATYTCPMHPQIIRSGPGVCPI